MTAPRPGLCSVTFRRLAPEEIVERAAEARLEVIEWGADEHVRPGDAERAAQVAQATTAAGLRVCSYGSYFRAGAGEQLTPILDSAEALGTDRVRLWAGRIGSAEATPDEYSRIVARLRDAAAEASDRGIGLALEYHGGTLADTPDAVLRLLGDVAHPALSTYWQPTVGAPDRTALAEFEAVAARTSAVHVFSWWPRTERVRLHERAGLWEAVLAAASAPPDPIRDALLEFVPGDDPALLEAEADTLRGWIASA